MPEAGALRRWLERSWYGPSASVVLLPLAWLYGVAVVLRRRAYQAGLLRSQHPGVPVVVVGNLTVGGTGKTPLVIWLASQLRAAGARPGVALRGYGGSVRAAHLVQPDDDPVLVGDEALLIQRHTAGPVAVAPRRIDAARLLARAGCDIVLCDDGLQHLALRRDLAIVVVDGERGFGNGALLPAGPLREPASRLAQADLVIVHGEDRHGIAPSAPAGLRMSLEPGPLRTLDGRREAGLDLLRGQTVHAVAGIGNPARFFAQLRALGAIPVEHAFADHHRYRSGDLDFGDDHRLVMTEKDAVKCRALADDRMWYLPVAARLSPADAGQLVGRSQDLLHEGGRHGA